MKRPLCLVCLAFLAMLVLVTKLRPAPVPDYEWLDGQRLVVEGKIYQKEYREQADGAKMPVLYLKSVHILDGFGDESGDSEHSGRNPVDQNPINERKEIQNIVCYMDGENSREPELGKTVRVEGKVRLFSEAGNPGEFDMRKYYGLKKLSFRLDHARITAYGGKTWYVREWLYGLKQYFAGVLENLFPEKEASIMKAMLLGEKDGLDEGTKELYQQSSIIHILSISGLHISMIGMGFYHLLRKAGLGLKASACAATVAVYGYGLMTGMSMSSVRAIFMFSLHLLANAIGRTYDMLTALSLAAALLLAQQPEYAGNSGFLFSFGAVASIGVLLPALWKEERPGKEMAGRGGRGMERMFRWKMLGWRIRQALASGIAVTLGTLPVHLMYYYRFPVYSILLNLAVIPLMGIVMGAGLLGMLAGVFFPRLAGGAAAVDRAILWLYEQMCLLGGKIPGGVLASGRPEGWQIFFYLLLLAALAAYVCLLRKKLPVFWKCQWILAALAILLLRTDQVFQVTMLDVGQGDCIHIRSGEGNDYLIDGGSSTKNGVWEYQIFPYLKYKGVDRLEAIFVTHSDSDHCSGILDLLEGYPAQGLEVGTVILPDIGRGSADEKYRKMEGLALEKGIRLQYMSRGQWVEDGAMRLTCMHPYAGYETEEANEYSLVLLLDYDGFTGLFTGDVEGIGEEQMWEYMEEREDMGRLTLLKVAHHGSGYSTGEEMLERLLPRLALISCGKNNRYGHPHEELLRRLERAESRIYATPAQGAVTVRKEGKKVRVSSFRKKTAY